MTQFKAGDRVECVELSDVGSPGRPGEWYTVEEVHGPHLILDGVSGGGVRASRFRLLSPPTATTGETLTTSSTGGQKGVKPQRYDLLPKAGLDAIAEVFAFGAEKYDSHNWRKGYEWSKSYSALMRHMTAHWEGETNDPESGLPHLAHAGCHIMFMLTWLKDQGEGSQFDDRFVKPE